MGFTVDCPLARFSIEKTIHAPRDVVFDIFANYENHSQLFPQHFPSIRIRSVRDTTAVVEEHMNLGKKELVMMAKHVTGNPVTHEIYIIGGDAKGTVIKEQFVELESGVSTKLLVDVDLKLPRGMVFDKIFGQKKQENDYSQIVSDFVVAAEKNA